MATSYQNFRDEPSEAKNISFVKDIQSMMFGLGDCPNPLLESAQLIEMIVLEQILSILHQAMDVGEIRGRTCVSPEDILFLMRNNLSALKRLITYLSMKDGKIALKKIMSTKEHPDPPPSMLPATQEMESVGDKPIDTDSEDESKGKSQSLWRINRQKCCLKFLEKIGIDEEDLDRVDDDVREERLSRANAITINLSSKSYEEYHQSRCVSFISNKMSNKKFIEWLKVVGKYREDISAPVAEILVYLAKETVATLIDMVLTLREETYLEPMIQPPPITADEIREVIRRCFSQQSVPMSLFSTDVMPTINKKIIAI